jgi:hypothetical protein
METTHRNGYRTFITLYSLFKSDRLNTNSNATLHKSVIRSLMTYACPAWEFAAESNEPSKQDPPHHWQISKEHPDS